MIRKRRKREKKWVEKLGKDGITYFEEAKKKRKQTFFNKCFETYVELILDLLENTFMIKEAIFQRKYDQEVISKLIPHILSLSQRMRENMNQSEYATCFWDLYTDPIFNYQWAKYGKDGIVECMYSDEEGYTIYFSLSADNSSLEIALSRKGILQHFIDGYRHIGDRKHLGLNRLDELQAIRDRALKNTQSNGIKNLTFKIMDSLDKNKNLLFFDIHERKRTINVTLPKFRNYLINHGYRCNKNNRKTICRILNNVITSTCTEEIISDIIKEINQGPEIIHTFLDGKKITKDDLIEAFLLNSGSLLNKHLLYSLEEVEVKPLRDQIRTSYIPYLNGVLEVKNDAVNFLEYKDVPAPVCKEQINERNYRNILRPEEDSVFYKFCFNLAKKDPQRFLSLRTILGYLINTHKDPINAFMIILMDERIPDFGEANGGVGKSLIGVALEKFRPVVSLDARRDDLKSKFALDRVTHTTNILYIEDADSDFNIDHAYNLITGKITVKVKYQSSFTLSFNDGFKILTTTNYVPTGSGGDSHDRRIIPFEVSDHYSLEYRPFDEFGHALFVDWDEEEYAKFDAFMIKCIQLFFEHGIVKPPKINVTARTIMQNTSYDFYHWFHKQYSEGMRSWDKRIELEAFKKLYPDYKSLTQNKFTMWIHSYLKTNKIKYRVETSDYRPTDTRGKIIVVD